jgi:hypothetical protein
MEVKFDIFLELPDGNPLWLSAVEGFERAKREIQRRILDSPGEYFLFNSRTGEIFRNLS